MEGISESSGSSQVKPRRGLEGTGLELPINRYGNLKSASTDQNLTKFSQKSRLPKLLLSSTMVHLGMLPTL
ncbi:hypothetical protein TorRG33x02_025260 [Trema orientale]|uniref:Uncharacterized protein n=1 Tax=Trema orientale TaxID=63057 RepID=A0A2P5FVD5_TREOI|nr:hypothetical protein TorRG33x02_025260 [Trema orientale]